jgi:hypothetical protein
MLSYVGKKQGCFLRHPFMDFYDISHIAKLDILYTLAMLAIFALLAT